MNIEMVMNVRIGMDNGRMMCINIFIFEVLLIIVDLFRFLGIWDKNFLINYKLFGIVLLIYRIVR